MSAHNGSVAPAAFPPPVDSQKEFIKRGLDPEDELIEVGVAIVGGGTAGLACANRLLQLLADDPETMERLGEVPVAVIEKAKTCGGHNLSGAVMRPGPLLELFPEMRLRARGATSPITLLGAPRMAMPCSRFGIAAVPAALRPMVLPSTWFPVAVASVICTPSKPFPAMRLPAPVAVPPTMVFGAPMMRTPDQPFPSAAVPLAFVPT